jgi:NADH-quinone oxidoreductase subunit L
MPANYLWLIPILPFAGFLLNGTLGRRLPRPAVTAIALLFTAIPAALVAWLWATMLHTGDLVMTVASRPWIAISGFQVNFAFAVDHLTLIMLAVVTGVGFLIHLYSAGYMAHEEGFWRFFAYLNLFMFFMLVLVLSSNFLLLFVGWEGVGLASYLLISFYFTKDSAANAGKKAFIVNRIGDFGFLLAMFLLIAHFGTLDFAEVFSKIGTLSTSAAPIAFLTPIALLLVLGATGKSAQIPLYVWLPDAMEGPTPVSALIHAATMVTAGIYMVARCHVLFNQSPAALTVIACIGAATAFFAACIGIVQHDIKRVLAYSTISQLGYMFLACGVGAYTAGIFHLMTHAFFKALLFLAAGSVIHALSGEQDMRHMGGLYKRIPITFSTMLMGVLAIAGIPPLAGFFSKDEILYQVFLSPTPYGKILWAIGLLTAGMTSFYMFRLLFKTFFGPENFEDQTHTTEDGHATLSIIGGWVGVPQAMHGHNEIEHFLAPVFTTTSTVAPETGSTTTELGLAAVSVLTALLGLFIAWFFYIKKPRTAAAIAARFPGPYSLVAHKFYIDELYGFGVTGLLMVTRIGLDFLIDRGIVNGSAKLAALTTGGLSNATRRIQSGNIRSYAGWLALGAAAVITIMVFGRFWTH